VTGEPLVGIDEVPVPQEPRQATAATQPIPRGDEVIPHEIDIEPEGFKLINNGRIFTPFWDEPVVVKPLGTGGANWPPSSYDPETNLFYVCVADGAAAYSTKEGGVEWLIPRPGGRYFGGEYTRSRVPRRGVLAAVDVTTNKLAWRQQWGELCYAGSTVTAGGLIFIGRNDGRLSAFDLSSALRRPSLRPPECARQVERRAAVGIPDGRRHPRGRQHVRAQRAAVRRRAIGRLVLPGHDARR